MKTENRQHLSYAALGAVIVAYLVIVQGLGLGLPIGLDVEYGTFPDVDTIVRAMTIPVAASLLFGIAVVSWLRWWPDVLTERNRVQRWVWIVPILMLAAALAVIDYSNLSAQSGSLVALTLITSLMVGAGEELMFRGISIQALRSNGMSEGRVALWSSLIFGGAHITNIFTEGPGAIVQVFIVSVSGYFFYLILRVSGTIFAAMLMHAIWDFSLFSHNVGLVDSSANARQLLPMVFNIVMVVILVVRRHHIERDDVTAPTPA